MNIISVVSGAITVLLTIIAAGWYAFDIEWRLRSLEAQNILSISSPAPEKNSQPSASILPNEIAAACVSIVEKLNDELKYLPNKSKVEAYQYNLKLLRCDR